MADWLLLRLPRTPDQAASWIPVDSRGVVQEAPRSGPLTLAAMQAAGRRLCVLVPASDVLLTEVQVPARAGAKLQQIVPYALEEQLADDIDDLHFAIGRHRTGSSRIPVAVVSRALMQEWLGMLKAAGLSPEAMYAESDLLPVNPGQAVALLEEDLGVVRPPGAMPVAVPVDALAEALGLAQSGEETSITTRGLIVYAKSEDWERHAQQVEALHDRLDSIKVQLLPGDPLTLFAQQLPPSGAVSLMQGPYVPASSHAAAWRSWRVAAMLLGALVGLHVAGKAAELVMLKRAEHALDASIEETFRAAMPGERNAVDARRRMEQRLLAVRSGTSAQGLLPGLGALVEARGSAPGLVVQALSYRGGILDLKIAAPDADSLDRVSKALRGDGWQADLVAGNVVDSGYEGRIQIRPRGS